MLLNHFKSALRDLDKNRFFSALNIIGLQLLAGRNFSRQFPSDAPTDSTQNYILNEAAVKAFGWETPELAIGKPFRMSGFAYRIDIPWWAFALAGMLTVAVAFLTVGFQSLKAALANPVESIKTE